MVLFPTEARFNERYIAAGMNAIGVAAKTIGGDTVVERCIVAGQYATVGEDPEVLRCLLIYRHVPTNVLGVFTQDIDTMFLGDLERLGMPKLTPVAISQ